MEQSNIKCCPVEKTLSLIGKKWSINIIRDMFAGKKHFSEFLASNTELSTKMLSARLKELQKSGLIEKKIVQTDPIKVEYELTKKGKGLNKVLFEISMFAVNNYKQEITGKKGPSCNQCEKALKESLGL